MSTTIGYFSTEDRDSCCCIDCAAEQNADGDFIHPTDDAITSDWDGADQFVCEWCGRRLAEVSH